MSTTLPATVAAPAAQAGGAYSRVARAALAIGFAALALPTLWDLMAGRWASHGQGHELLFVAVSAWLLRRRAGELFAHPPANAAWPGTLMAFGLALYLFGRSQQWLRAEILGLVVVLAALLAFAGGRRALRAAAFPLAFLLFIVPLPYAAVLALTAPLKTAVSACAVQLMSWLGLPVARAGVVVTIGQYELLVSEACAGLQTMFTLEAMGLLYATLRGAASLRLNLLLALCVVPVSFASNVVRVIVLMAVTWTFGDAVGRGFLHGFAGLLLFVVALGLIFSIDCALRRWVTP
jgi:exosortase B